MKMDFGFMATHKTIIHANNYDNNNDNNVYLIKRPY